MLDIAMVLVFTKYDQLIDMKEDHVLRDDPEIEEDDLLSRSRAEAEEEFDECCVRTLKKFASESGSRLPPIVKVSGAYIMPFMDFMTSDEGRPVEESYQSTLSELVRATEDCIEDAERYRLEVSGEALPGPSEDAVESTSVSLMAMAQRVDLESKVKLAIR